MTIAGQVTPPVDSSVAIAEIAIITMLSKFENNPSLANNNTHTQHSTTNKKGDADTPKRALKLRGANSVAA